jgi:hypothetical protein
MFERPIKGDLDRSLSLLMHDSRHKLMDECNHIKSEAIKAGALRSNRLISTVVQAADQLHKEAMDQAVPILFDFIGRMQIAPVEITAWARPHLENLGNSLLGVVPPNGFPADYQRIRAQYNAVFQQRLDGVLRDVEIGFVKGAGFARAKNVDSKEEWITAAEAARLLKPVCETEYGARMTICKRAYSGLIRARAERFMIGTNVHNEHEIPKEFWWAEGHEALTQNWPTGDFDTWVKTEPSSPAGIWRFVFTCRYREDDSPTCCQNLGSRYTHSIERRTAKSRLVGRALDRSLPTTIRG